ncbi:bacteriocin-like protein [Chryseobacterium mucoviscidosis]|uniref:bacteriocin-like protein n=1 Tax=Chryseobacterium mucoviscidosis TaxID=1945581 RepID=UPI000F4D6121|nr:hypothetical protein [Chryseobacterium mucoviscidosis]
MKNLKKISREKLKSVKGGITPECASWWSSGRPYYTTEAACLQAAGNNPDLDPFCVNKCGRWYAL